MSLPALIYNGLTIGTQQEMVCLTDLWRSAGSDMSKRPPEWLRSLAATDFIDYLSENLKVGISHLVITERGGTSPATWAHWQIAYAYGKYLSPEVHIYCNTVLRAHFEGNSIAKSALPVEIIGGLLDTKLAPLHDEMLEQRRETGELREIVERTDGNVTYMLNASMPRRDFKARAWKIWKRAIGEYHSGRCPCGCGQKIMDHLGNWLKEATEDHWYARNRNKRNEGWPVLANCNHRLKNPKERMLAQHAFAVFQHNCDLIEQRLALGKAISKSRRGNPTQSGPDQFEMFK
jgi:hypothetical protein